MSKTSSIPTQPATVTLTSGPLDYTDSGGDGPVVVLLNGLMTDGSLYAGVIDAVGGRCRCIAPTLPLGAHRHPAGEDADLSLPGIATIVSELLERLGVSDVTLVGNDTGGAVAQLLMASGEPRLGAAVLVSCDAFDNFPPGLTGRTLVRLGSLPPSLFGFAMQQLRVRPLRRLPLSFGWLTRRGDAAVKRFLAPAWSDRAIRRDAVRALRAIAADRELLVRAADALPRFERPVLVVWAREDRVMPPEHGRRLADLLPDARLVEVEDSYSLIPLDQPAVLAEQITAFALERRSAPAAAAAAAAA